MRLFDMVEQVTVQQKNSRGHFQQFTSNKSTATSFGYNKLKLVKMKMEAIVGNRK